jgi:TetR/AcrR family transcriptional regulator, transcriptional repressor for nem operon
MIQRKPNLAKSAPRIKSRQQQSDPSDADAPDSRERIVLAASNFFLTGGYNGVGIAEICEAASVHKGTFYHFFPSKTELLLVVIDRRVAVVEDAILTIAGRTDTPERKILALFAMPQDRLGQDQPRDFQSPGQFLGNIILELASTNPPVRTAARKALDRWSKAIEKIIALLLDEEGLINLQASDAAEMVLGLLQGGTIMASAHNEPRTMRAFGHIALTVLRSAGKPS